MREFKWFCGLMPAAVPWERGRLARYKAFLFFGLCMVASRTLALLWLCGSSDKVSIQKSVELFSVTRSTSRGLRIARNDKTSNAEAHADMICVHPPSIRKSILAVISHRDIYRCFVLIISRKLRSFYLSRTKRQK